MRCFGDGDPLYSEYHDREWGRPVVDERGLYERLCLESFQSGLSWAIVLRKRASIRAGFRDFDPDRVARFGAEDIARLLADPGVIRNRAKIEAAIANARATRDLRDGDTPLEALVWSFRPPRRRAPRSFEGVAPFTPESKALSAALKKAGFRFVGPTTAYATMQAAGLVNDHLAQCIVRAEVEREQAAVTR
ncbi:MAG: DNA-3-methyladenine glycosylase I [Actinomycetota bacterium]